MGKATRALGTKLTKGTQDIAGLTSIGGIEITADTIDTTTLDSDGGYREFIGAFKDAGEVPIEGFFDPENPDYQKFREIENKIIDNVLGSK